MALFSNLLSKEEKLKDLRTPQQQQLGTSFLSSLQRGVSGFAPGAAFPGSLNIGLSDEEDLGLSRLGSFADSSLADNEAFQAGRSHFLDTLAGSFDPNTSDTFKAVRAEIDRNKQEAIDDARRGSAVRGDFRSTGSQRVEGDIIAETTNRVNTILTQLAEKERDRQFTAANQAAGIGQIEQQEPLQQAQALTSIGALPRLIEEANLARALQDFQRQQQEGQNALQFAGSASNLGQPLLGQDTVTTPTFLGSLLQGAGSGIGIGAGRGLANSFFK